MSQGLQLRFYTVQNILNKPTSSSQLTPNEEPVLLDPTSQGDIAKAPLKHEKSPDRKKWFKDEEKAELKEISNSAAKGQFSASQVPCHTEDKQVAEIQSSSSSCKNSENKSLIREMDLPEFKKTLSELKSLEETLRQGRGDQINHGRKVNQNRDINYFLERRNTPKNVKHKTEEREGKIANRSLENDLNMIYSHNGIANATATPKKIEVSSTPRGQEYVGLLKWSSPVRDPGNSNKSPEVKQKELIEFYEFHVSKLKSIIVGKNEELKEKDLYIANLTQELGNISAELKKEKQLNNQMKASYEEMLDQIKNKENKKKKKGQQKDAADMKKIIELKGWLEENKQELVDKNKALKEAEAENRILRDRLAGFQKFRDEDLSKIQVLNKKCEALENDNRKLVADYQAIENVNASLLVAVEQNQQYLLLKSESKGEIHGPQKMYGLNEEHDDDERRGREEQYLLATMGKHKIKDRRNFLSLDRMDRLGCFTEESNDNSYNSIRNKNNTNHVKNILNWSPNSNGDIPLREDTQSPLPSNRSGNPYNPFEDTAKTERNFLENSLKKLENDRRLIETELLKLPHNARTLVQKMKIRSLEVELEDLESKISLTKARLKKLR